jgi:hypothetical protein
LIPILGHTLRYQCISISDLSQRFSILQILEGTIFIFSFTLLNPFVGQEAPKINITAFYGKNGDQDVSFEELLKHFNCLNI